MSGRQAIGNERLIPRRAEEIRTWNVEADVVIVGYGIAGAAAAAEASLVGADTVVLDRAGGWGGASALASGFVYLGGGTAVQKACGFDDDPDEMFKFLVAALGPGADERKIRLYSDESVELYEWLVALGVPFNHSYYGEPGWSPYGGAGLMYCGGENAWPYNQIARPAPRGHHPPLHEGGGRLIVEPIVRQAERHGAKAIYNARVDSLIVDRDHRVVGLVARRFGEEMLVRARKGVVLAAGTFIYNDQMMLMHAPLMLGRPESAVQEHEGGGILAAQASGAAVAHMDACEVSAAVDPPVVARGIVVNGVGQRFVNEDTYGGRISQLLLFHQDNLGFAIVDERCMEEADRHPRVRTSTNPPTSVCATLAELEKEIGLPPGSLEATVGLYNRHAANGEDPMFHKDPRWLRPLEAPFGAYRISDRTGGFTIGGLCTTVDAEVLHVGGDPIPGLYAAGRTASGISAWGYVSGASLGDGAFFGRKAGRAVARG